MDDFHCFNNSPDVCAWHIQFQTKKSITLSCTKKSDFPVSSYCLRLPVFVCLLDCLLTSNRKIMMESEHTKVVKFFNDRLDLTVYFYIVEASSSCEERLFYIPCGRSSRESSLEREFILVLSPVVRKKINSAVRLHYYNTLHSHNSAIE